MFEFGKRILTNTVSLLVNLAVVDGFHDVPSASGSDNNQMRDVVGNKTDSHGDISLIGRAKQTNEHLHAINQLYPVLAGPVELEKASGAYAAFPFPTEIIPVNTITEDFDIHWLIASAISANGDFIIRLYQGNPGSETVIATKSVVRNAVQSQEGALQMVTPLMVANKRISAALSGSNAGQDTLSIKLEYHTY